MPIYTLREARYCTRTQVVATQIRAQLAVHTPAGVRNAAVVVSALVARCSRARDGSGCRRVYVLPSGSIVSVSGGRRAGHRGGAWRYRDHQRNSARHHQSLPREALYPASTNNDGFDSLTIDESVRGAG
jgi:hypothetical protein